MARIALGGIDVESSNFSPLPTVLDDFDVLRSQELLAADRYRFLADLNADFVPTLCAHALPGGPVAQVAYQTLKTDLLTRLADAGPVDGIYLDLHGAMYVADMEDAEADLAAAVRALVGPDVLIAASMDLHGNISKPYVDTVDLVTAYRTAPHRDTVETRRRACQMLINAISAGIRPVIGLVPIPVLLSGETTRTDMEPGSRLWYSLARIDQKPGVIDASLFVGFAWVDEPRAHAAAVITGTNDKAVRRQAAYLAQAYWDARHEFAFGTPAGSIEESIEWARSAHASTVFISDSGDNVTAGAPGDLAIFLEQLLAVDVSDVLVAGIADAPAIDRILSSGQGATVGLELGGKLDTIHGRPLPVQAQIVRVVEPTMGQNIQAHIRVGNVDVLVTKERTAFTMVSDFDRLGIDPLDYKIVVVKLGYLFPDLLRIAPAAYLALSPGAADLDLERLPYRHIERPMFPLDKDMHWTAPREP